jgi:hypothetical protein
LLFIDANKYLDLYRTMTGKKLLDPLGEQAAHIFVTQQVVEEVQRNKVRVAAEYFTRQFADLKLQTFNVTDHLCGTEVGQNKIILEEMGKIVERIRKVNNVASVVPRRTPRTGRATCCTSSGVTNGRWRRKAHACATRCQMSSPLGLRPRVTCACERVALPRSTR